jgi:hypothetical protein
MKFNIKDTQPNATLYRVAYGEWHFVENRILFIFITNVVVLSVVILSVVMLIVVMLSVVMLHVVAPFLPSKYFEPSLILQVRQAYPMSFS